MMNHPIREHTLIALSLALATFLATTGCGSSDSSSPGNDSEPDANGSPQSIDVEGKVIQQAGVPLKGIQVGLLATNEVKLTDTDGRFSITDVEPPYDLAVMTRQDTPLAVVYKGLSRTDPVLAMPREPSHEVGVASVEGTLSGGFFDNAPMPSADYVGGFVPSGESDPTYDVTPDIRNNGNFFFDVSWSGPSTLDGQFHVLQYRENNESSDIAEIGGYGTTSPLSLNDGDDVEQLGIALDTSVGVQTIEGTVSVPNGMSLGSVWPFARINNTTLGKLGPASDSPDFSRTIPASGPFTTDISAAAFPDNSNIRQLSYAFRSGVGDTSGDISISLNSPPELSTPNDGATDIGRQDQFEWNAPTQGVQALLVAQPNGDVRLLVFSDESSTSLPNLEPFGYGLEEETEFLWGAIHTGPHNSIDNAATEPFADILSAIAANEALANVESTTDFSLSVSRSRNFTTAD